MLFFEIRNHYPNQIWHHFISMFKKCKVEKIKLTLVFISSTGLKVTKKGKNVGNMKEQAHQKRRLQFTKTPISTTKRDITTPITTVPTITPTNPTSSIPIANPNSDPDSTSPVSATPSMTPFSTTPSSTGSSWCVASQSASQMALQVALDYACGYGGTDCSEIQSGRSCYNPNNVRDHASFAFNNYYQKNPVPNSCNFGGTAVITSTDPSNIPFLLLFFFIFKFYVTFFSYFATLFFRYRDMSVSIYQVTLSSISAFLCLLPKIFRGREILICIYAFWVLGFAAQVHQS